MELFVVWAWSLPQCLHSSLIVSVSDFAIEISDTQGWNNSHGYAVILVYVLDVLYVKKLWLLNSSLLLLLQGP